MTYSPGGGEAVALKLLEDGIALNGGRPPLVIPELPVIVIETGRVGPGLGVSVYCPFPFAALYLLVYAYPCPGAPTVASLIERACESGENRTEENALFFLTIFAPLFPLL